MLGSFQARAAALAVLVAASTLVAACQSAPTPSELQDPRAILAAAVTTTAAAKTVRVDATAYGSVAVDLLGIGAASTVELNGTTASADLDLARGNARTTFSAPGILGLTGELIALDGTSYFKSTLTGTLYQVQPLGAAAPVPSGAITATVLKGLTDLPRTRPSAPSRRTTSRAAAPPATASTSRSRPPTWPPSGQATCGPRPVCPSRSSSPT